MTKHLASRFLTTALFNSLLISGAIAAPATTSYLDPTADGVTVKQDTCFFAAPAQLLLVEPRLSDQGERVYNIRTISQNQDQKWYYHRPLEEQIASRSITSKMFCHGIAAISNLDLPFSNQEAMLDENDGLQLTHKMRQGLVETDHVLQKLRQLANLAANGTYSSKQLQELNRTFQLELNKVDDIAHNTIFNKLWIFDGSHETLTIPTTNGQAIDVRMENTTTGSAGLNIATLSVASQMNASTALSTLDTAIDTTHFAMMRIPQTEHSLQEALQQDADVTWVDVSNDAYSVQYSHAYPTDATR